MRTSKIFDHRYHLLLLLNYYFVFDLTLPIQSSCSTESIALLSSGRPTSSESDGILRCLQPSLGFSQLSCV